MKKVGITLLTAFVGGAVALGGYKLLTHNDSFASIAENQKVYFANNVTGGEGVSSAGTPDFVAAASAVTPAVVHIEVQVEVKNRRSMGEGMNPLEDFFDMFGQGQRISPNQGPRLARGSGSGVILTSDGYIITNNHVVEGAKDVSVVLSDKKRYKAKVVGTDPNTDIALIKIDASNLPIVKLGNSDAVKVGEWVLAVGYPLDLNTTVTAGIVSAKRRKIDIIKDEKDLQRQYMQGNETPTSSGIESFIQTDAAINRGNSGGALVNSNGELVGINAAIASQSGFYEGYGFAIPINLAIKVVEDIKKFGVVKRGYLGVTFQELNSDAAKALDIDDIDGMYVNEVVKGGGAEAAGLKKGDIIKQVNGQIVINSADLQEQIGRLSPGDKVKLLVKRDGKEKEFTVTLKEAPKVAKEEDEDQAGNTAKKSNGVISFKDLGASFVPLNSRLKSQLGLKNGVVVNSVTGGILGDYNIEEGSIITQVNGVKVNSVEDIKSALNKQKGVLDLMLISPDGIQQQIKLKYVN